MSFSSKRVVAARAVEKLKSKRIEARVFTVK